MFLGQAFFAFMNSDEWLANLDSQTNSAAVDRITCWIIIHFKEKVSLEPQIRQNIWSDTVYSL